MWAFRVYVVFVQKMRVLKCASTPRSLGLNSQKEWEAWGKRGARPANMPSHPDTTYKHEGWQEYGHWLGTGTMASYYKEFLPFEDALAVARSLGLTSEKEWRAWCKSGARPANMPSSPHKTYKHEGWQGYGHWLNSCNHMTIQFLSFEQGLAVAQLL